MDDREMLCSAKAVEQFLDTQAYKMLRNNG